MIKRVSRLVGRYWYLSLILLTIAIGAGLHFLKWQTVNHWFLGWAAVLLTIPMAVQLWRDLQHGRLGFDLLGGTAVISAVVLHQYWLAVFILLGRAVSELVMTKVLARSQRQLHRFDRRSSQTAHVLRGRRVVDVTARNVTAGDKLVVQPGETVPVDATILEGASRFDEDALTGGSVPIACGVGQTILAGSINLDATVTVRALHAASDSQAYRLDRVLRGTTGQPAKFVRLAETFSIPFTLLALAIAVGAWIVNDDSSRYLSVLVAASVSPLLFAVPIAFTTGIGRAGKHGIIPRTGSVVEQLTDIQTLAFDSDGVLTTGTVEVGEITDTKPYGADEVLGLAASLAQTSSFATNQALVEAATAKGIKLTRIKHVQESPDHSLQATHKGQLVLVGQKRLLETHGIAVPAKPKADNRLYVVIGDVIAGTIRLETELRPDAATTLERLKKFGVTRTMLVTSHSQSTADSLAKHYHIDEVHAEALPSDKLYALSAATERPVAFVGDGVEDASVLTAADLGIALGARGEATASQSAQLVVLRPDFALVAAAIGFARRTLRVARLAVVLGLTLDLALMLAMATDTISPYIGIAAVAALDILVTLYALRAGTSKESL